MSETPENAGRILADAFGRSVGEWLKGIAEDLAGSPFAPADVERDNTRPEPPETAIVEWPQATRPPLMMSMCTACGTLIEGHPAPWEIVIGPGATDNARSVQGRMTHAHEDGTVVTWPVEATFTPAPVGRIRVPSIEDVQHTFAETRDADEIDVEEGQETGESRDPWEFTPEEDGSLSVRSAVFQALGGASTCWDDLSTAGAFESERAAEIGERLMGVIEKQDYRDEQINRQSARAAAAMRVLWDDEQAPSFKVAKTIDILSGNYDDAIKAGRL